MMVKWSINEISVDKNILNELSKCPTSLTKFCEELTKIDIKKIYTFEPL